MPRPVSRVLLLVNLVVAAVSTMGLVITVVAAALTAFPQVRGRISGCPKGDTRLGYVADIAAELVLD